MLRLKQRRFVAHIGALMDSSLSAIVRLASAPMQTHRLCKHADYQLVYKGGRKQFAKQMAYFYTPRPDDRRSATTGPRIGLTVPKALGKAVDRNRIKRRMREAVRHALPVLTAPVDVILHPRRSVIDADFRVIEREVSVIFRSIQAAFERGLSQKPVVPTEAL